MIVEKLAEDELPTERVVRFEEKLRPRHVAEVLGNGELWVVHETHYHEDGSQSETYYLELSEKQHAALRTYGGGEGNEG